MAGVEVGLGGPAGGVVEPIGDRRILGRALGLPRSVALVAGQQRVLLELGVHEGVELNIGELQELDSLLQLRRDDQRLALPNLETCTERHLRPLWPVSCFRLVPESQRSVNAAPGCRGFGSTKVLQPVEHVQRLPRG